MIAQPRTGICERFRVQWPQTLGKPKQREIEVFCFLFVFFFWCVFYAIGNHPDRPVHAAEDIIFQGACACWVAFAHQWSLHAQPNQKTGLIEDVPDTIFGRQHFLDYVLKPKSLEIELCFIKFRRKFVFAVSAP